MGPARTNQRDDVVSHRINRVHSETSEETSGACTLLHPLASKRRKAKDAICAYSFFFSFFFFNIRRDNCTGSSAACLMGREISGCGGGRGCAVLFYILPYRRPDPFPISWSLFTAT